MQQLPLVVASLVASGATVFVALPFLRRPSRADRGAPQHADASQRLALLERRDRALAALKELEFDHRTGKLSDGDYRALLAPLRREAVEALRLVEGAEAPPPPRRRSPAKRRRDTPSGSRR